MTSFFVEVGGVETGGAKLCTNNEQIAVALAGNEEIVREDQGEIAVLRQKRIVDLEIEGLAKLRIGAGGHHALADGNPAERNRESRAALSAG